MEYLISFFNIYYKDELGVCKTRKESVIMSLTEEITDYKSYIKDKLGHYVRKRLHINYDDIELLSYIQTEDIWSKGGK